MQCTQTLTRARRFSSQIEANKDITDLSIESLTAPRIRFGIIGAGSANSIVSSVHGIDDCRTAAIHIAIGSKCAVDVSERWSSWQRRVRVVFALAPRVSCF